MCVNLSVRLPMRLSVQITYMQVMKLLSSKGLKLPPHDSISGAALRSTRESTVAPLGNTEQGTVSLSRNIKNTR